MPRFDSNLALQCQPLYRFRRQVWKLKMKMIAEKRSTYVDVSVNSMVIYVRFNLHHPVCISLFILFADVFDTVKL